MKINISLGNKFFNKSMDQNNKTKNPNTGIEFNEEYNGERAYSPEISGIVSWVIKSSGGLIKNEKQANYVLIGIVIVAVGISLFLVFGGGKKSELETYAPTAEITIPAEI